MLAIPATLALTLTVFYLYYFLRQGSKVADIQANFVERGDRKAQSDFVEQRTSEGVPLEQAVVDAGAIRFRPMLLTAAAVVVGAFVILFDPICQGLAISLMAGEIASLLLSRMTVPIVYFLVKRREERRAERHSTPMPAGETAVLDAAE